MSRSSSVRRTNSCCRSMLAMIQSARFRDVSKPLLPATRPCRSPSLPLPGDEHTGDLLRVAARTVAGMAIVVEWRGPFTNEEANALHAEAFGTRMFSADEWNWERLLADHSLGWVTARDGGSPDGTPLVGLVNVVWDGLVHAWLQDLMVGSTHRYQGIG